MINNYIERDKAKCGICLFFKNNSCSVDKKKKDSNAICDVELPKATGVKEKAFMSKTGLVCKSI